MDLITQVQETFKWKRSNIYCAHRLNISLDEYVQLKYDILEQQRTEKIGEESSITEKEKSVKFNTDYKTNKTILEYSGPKEIKTKEDIVKECNIDLDQWDITRMIHNSWGKEGNQNYQVKVWLEQKKQSTKDLLEDIISNFDFKYTPIETLHLNSIFVDKTCAVLSLQDIHIAKEVMDKTGSSIEESVKACIQNLILRSYHSSLVDKVVFVLGGDLVNMDTYLGTTTAGTLVENSMPAYDAYKVAFELMFWSINYLKQFCNKLEVVYIPGNHSRLTEAHMAYSLSKCITDPKIIWNIEYAERKVIVYGNSFLAFEHGDQDTRKSFFAFATEFAPEWGSTKFRTLYTGHYHKEKKIEYLTTDEINGFTIKVLPSLSKTDRYHYSGKWTKNKRGGIIELHSEIYGPTGQFSYYE